MASQGPLLGTVMWPQAERSCCLFAEGGKTTLRTIDSASPWCSWLSSQCLPWLPSSDYARWWAWNKPGGSSGSSTQAGLESSSKDAQERALGPASVDGCGLSPKGRRSLRNDSLPGACFCSLHPKSPTPSSQGPSLFK